MAERAQVGAVLVCVLSLVSALISAATELLFPVKSDVTVVVAGVALIANVWLFLSWRRDSANQPEGSSDLRRRILAPCFVFISASFLAIAAGRFGNLGTVFGGQPGLDDQLRHVEEVLGRLCADLEDEYEKCTTDEQRAAFRQRIVDRGPKGTKTATAVIRHSKNKDLRRDMVLVLEAITGLELMPGDGVLDEAMLTATAQRAEKWSKQRTR